MKSLIAVAAISAAALLVSISAHAQEVASCSAAGQVCYSAVRQKVPAPEQASWFARCNTAVSQCRARCKQGQKFFIGISDGAQHTVGSCG